MERINLADTRYSHLHPLYVNEKGGLYVDKTAKGFIEGMFLHLEIVEWNIQTYKEFKVIWIEIQNSLVKAGVTRLFALPPSPKEEKLIKMFGLTDSGLTIHGSKLMEKTLCRH